MYLLYTALLIPGVFDREVVVIKSLLAVMIGAGIGGVLRWSMSLKFNTAFPSLPPGTLLVNLAGGFIIGAAMAFFLRNPDIDPVWKLFITTGLCGGLTTFSTFSLEVMSALQAGNITWAFTSIFVHVTGSLIMTALGYLLVSAL